MLTVEIVQSKDLPEPYKEEFIYCTRDCLVVKLDNTIIRVESSEMEPEDVSFYRDLKWVKQAILEAYDIGFSDGMDTMEAEFGVEK
jgi:hypothetical protein